MDYIRVGSVNELEGKTLKGYRIFGKVVAVLNKGNGNYEAIEAGCKHQGADLTEGELKGWVVTCPRHGWRYNLESGNCVNHDSLPLKKYAIKIESGDIHISFQPIEE